MSSTDTSRANRDIAVEAITGTFVHRDKSIPARLFAEDYIQHNPMIPSGRAALPGLIDGLAEKFSYEMGMVVAEGDLVMIHGRYVGWGPKPLIGVDIFRVADGLLVEHWDVLQEEIPQHETVSGNPMFTRAHPA